jgi:hypothetical protein
MPARFCDPLFSAMEYALWGVDRARVEARDVL